MNGEPSSLPENGGRLGRLRPRDTSAARSRSATYSRVVGSLRRILIGLVLLGVVVLIAWPMWKARSLSGLIVQNVPNLVVEKLHLTGLDERNQAYSVTAARALQAADPAHKNLVDLEKPEGEIALEGGAWLSGHAAYGRLDQADKKLWLGGGVEFFHDAGYRFLTDEMNVDMTQSAAWGQKPVLLQGSFGEVRGAGFRLLDGGKTLIVTGPATARLDLRGASGSGKPSGKDSTSR